MKARIFAAAAFCAAVCPAFAQSDEDLRNDGRNTDNVLTYGLGYSQHRFSRLDQINKKNVRRLFQPGRFR